MGNQWYDDLSEQDSKFYEESVSRIKKGIEQGMTFEQGVSLVEFNDDSLKAAIIDDALKILIAEMHFMGKQSIEDVAKKLRLPLEVLNKSRQEMIDSVEAAAIEAYKASQGQQGNA